MPVTSCSEPSSWFWPAQASPSTTASPASCGVIGAHEAPAKRVLPQLGRSAEDLLPAHDQVVRARPALLRGGSSWRAAVRSLVRAVPRMDLPGPARRRGGPWRGARVYRAPRRRAPRALGHPLLRLQALARALWRRAMRPVRWTRARGSRGGWALAAVTERSLAPEINVVDILDDVVGSRTGHLTLVYRVEAFHEPGLDGADFDAAALLAENSWAGLPEGTCYQFYVFVDQRRGIRRLEDAMPPIAGDGPKERLLEEFRRARLDELTRIEENGAPSNLVQDRRHYLCATFRPVVQTSSSLAGTLQGISDLFQAWARREPRSRSNRWQTTYEALVEEAARFARRVEVGLSQMGLGFERCRTSEVVGLVYELLNPTASAMIEVDCLSERARNERDRLRRSIVEEIPYAGDTSPVWSLLNDDLLIRRDHLRLGDRFVGVISLKELPDRTEPGILVPLLALNRERYVLYYRVDIPRAGAELAALRAKATLAAGLKLENCLVTSDRTDARANAVEKQSDAAMERLISSTQRIFGTTLQLVLYEAGASGLEEAVQETLAVLSRAHCLPGYRETYLLREAYLALLPGATPLVDRPRKSLTPSMADMLPVWGFQSRQGKVPFLTPHNGLVLYDPFDTSSQPNANILVTGTSGAGKSFAVSYLLSAYEVACAGRGDRPPFTFILDNGASYRRYIELRPDARYVAYDFDHPPGVQPFLWNEDDEALDEHVSRLEWLLLDLLHVSHP